MVVIAILGILGATAMPLYRTWQQRAYGSQAAVIARQLVNAQILHYLEHNKFFPKDSSIAIFIPPDIPPDAATQQFLDDVKSNLNIDIPLGKHLNYQINTGDADADQWCQIRIWAPFPLFKNGRNDLNYNITKAGAVIPF